MSKRLLRRGTQASRTGIYIPPVGGVGNFPTAPIVPSASNYAIPGSATVVTSQAGLESALASGTPQDIKVMNGSYSRSSPMSVTTGHRIWCESTSGVMFDYGFQFGNTVGWQFHGGTITIVSSAKAASASGDTAAIMTWFGSTTTNATVTDVTINGGNGTISHGIDFGQPGGAVIQRCVISNCGKYGVRLSDNAGTGKIITTVTDLNIWGIYERGVGLFGSGRGSWDGRAEAALWVANPVVNPVTRMKFRDTGWMGLWTGDECSNTTFSHLDIDNCWGTNTYIGPNETGTGIYLERQSPGCIFEYFWIGRDSGSLYQGIKCEWDTGVAGTAAARNCIFRYGTIRAERAATPTVPTMGLALDEHSDNNVAHHIRFEGMKKACIEYYANYNTTVANFYSNDYSARAAGCARGSTVHANTGGTWPEAFNGATDIVIAQAW